MYKDSKSLKSIIIIFLIISFCLIIVSQFINWGTLKLDANVGGGLAGAAVTLDAEFNEYKVDYNLKTDVSTPFNKKVEEEKHSNIFLTGMGDFQTKVGWVLNSYKDKQYTLKAIIWNNKTGVNEYTNITVATHSDLIPWWPVDIAQKVAVSVKLNSSSSLTQKVIINRVWIELLTGWDDDKNDYTKSEEVWDTKPNDELRKVGDSREYKTELKIKKEYGKFGIVGYADITVLDSSGEPVKKILKPFTSESHPATINLYSISQNEFYSVVLMVLAFPFTIIGFILTILAIPFVLKSHRIGTALILSAAIFALLAVIFYINGLNTLVDIIDSELKIDVRDGFELNYATISMPVISFVLLFIAFGFALINQLPKQKKDTRPWLSRSTTEAGYSSGGESEPELVFKPIDEDQQISDEPVYEFGAQAAIPGAQRKKIRKGKTGRKKKR